jgi:cytochrome c-type biogenesis protein CcmE
MASRLCFVFVVFYLAAILLFAVWVRTANRRMFYNLRKIDAQQSRLKQQLWEKQLQLEGLVNPASVWERVESALEAD